MASIGKSICVNMHTILDEMNDSNLHEKKAQLSKLINDVEQENTRSILQILYDFEKQNLDLIKEHTDEIKFAAAAQQDIRRERAQFFATTLKEVAITLKEAQVDDSTAAKWLVELVSCYTESLNQSASLVENGVVETVSILKEKTSKIKRSVMAAKDEE